MLSISSGYSPEYLLREVATGRESYYTGAVMDGEPPGRWWGAGAEKLGLTGLVDAQDMRAVYERFLDPRDENFRDPDRWDEAATLGHTGRRYATEDELYAVALEREPDASPERRAELRTEAGKAARHNVAFLDVTFSVQKSVTLLHAAFEAQEVAARKAGDEETAAAWGEFRKAVEDAIWAGNNAALVYLQDKAGYSRVGHHGGTAGRYVDAHEWTVASFFQHDSRDHDPQLHIHNPVSNRVQGPDGEWRTLDGRSLYRWRPAAGAVAERTTEERVTDGLGMLFKTRADGKAREIVGVSAEAMGLISSRRRAVTAKAAELIEEYEQRYGRAPNSAQRDRISRQATLATRKTKSPDGETRAEFLERVDGRLRADIAGGLAGVADAALAARDRTVEPMSFSPQAVIETALEDVRQRKAAWTRADLTRAINAALPDYLGLPDGDAVAELLDQLTDRAIEHAVALDAERPAKHALPDELRLANGDSAYEAPGARLYSTPDHVRSERILLASASADRDGTAVPDRVARGFLDRLADEGIQLGPDQTTAIRGILTSGARVETLVGPAGTGKSFVVGTLARGWTDPSLREQPRGQLGPRVFGLATSQMATDVLTAEGLTARNVSSWLWAQHRLHTGAAERPHRAEDEAWRLREGDLVVVDESAMTDTASLSAVHGYAERAGAKLLLVGDHRQLAAVGAGGGMELLAAAGSRYELADARRFDAPWEREASLRLRVGDEDVLGLYHRHGRILDVGTRDEAEASGAEAWLADTLAGHRSLLLVDTNEQAARVSAQIRAELVRLGRVTEDGVVLGRQGTFAGIGDVVQARDLRWDLAGYEGNVRGPVNGEKYRVTAIRDDGGLEVSTDLTGDGEGERLVLPPTYVEKDLALGYACTIHAAQGSTVDTTHSVVTGKTAADSLYVGMSRGRASNTAHVTTQTGVEDPAHGGDRHSLHREPLSVIAGILDTGRDAAPPSALATATAAVERADSVRTAAEMLADAAQLAATERTASWLDQLALDGALTLERRSRIAAEDGTATLTRILRRAEVAGSDPRAVLDEAIERGPLTGSRNVTNVLYSRIRDVHRFDPAGETWADWIPKVDNHEWRDYLAALAEAADKQAEKLGLDAVAEPPAWAVEALGPVPVDPIEQQDWRHKAGTIAAYRELRGHDDANRVLGPAPKPGQVEEFAAYRAAWRALGRPETDREHLEMSNGQLRMRVRAAEREEAWAPRYVADELAGTRQAAAAHRRDAALRRAEAEASAENPQREQLLAEAYETEALAAVLEWQGEQLQEVDDARARWLAHTAATRAEAESAAAELSTREVDNEPEVTAAEWAEAHRAATAEEERHREVTEDDIEQDRRDDVAVANDDRAETDVDDLRVVAAEKPARSQFDAVRVPEPAEVADSIGNARRALAEIEARQTMDERETVEHRDSELKRWHGDDVAETETPVNYEDAGSVMS